MKQEWQYQKVHKQRDDNLQVDIPSYIISNSHLRAMDFMKDMGMSSYTCKFSSLLFLFVNFHSYFIPQLNLPKVHKQE